MHPVDRQKVLERLPTAESTDESSIAEVVSSVLVDMLQSMRDGSTSSHTRKSRVKVIHGKSISADDLNISDKPSKQRRLCEDNDSVIDETAGNDSVITVSKETVTPDKVVTSNEPCASVSWEEMRNVLRTCDSYTAVKEAVNRHHSQLPDIEIAPPFLQSIMSTKSTVGRVALSHMPADSPAKPDMMPVITGADGNCLPRSLSKIVYGTEDNHEEMRTRIVVEGVKNETTYLSHNYLAHGEVTDRHRRSFRKKPTPLPVVYAQYSDEYIPGSRLMTEQDIYEIYQRELVTIIQPGKYMGTWQLFQACNILKCPLT